MVDPATAILIAQAVASAAKAGGEYFSNKKGEKAAKRSAKEKKRETIAGLMNDAMQGSAENASHHLNERGKLSKRKGKSAQDTSAIVRGALSI